MNRVEEKLTELLHAATPEPPTDVPFEAVTRRVRRRRRIAVGGTALATVAVLAVGAALAPRLIQQQATEPARKVPATVPDPVIPGVDKDLAAQLRRKCQPILRAASGPNAENGRQPGEELLATPLRLYNYLSLPEGYSALFYNERAIVFCGQDNRIKDKNGWGGYGSLETHTSDWLDGDLTLDAERLFRRGPAPRDGSMVRPSKQLLQVVAGRVSERTAKVTFNGADGSSVTVTPVNGTYIALIYLKVASAAALDGPDGANLVIGTVSAFDAGGRLLMKRGDLRHDDCYAKPDGTDVFLERKPRPGELGPCQPATRWRP